MSATVVGGGICLMYRYLAASVVALSLAAAPAAAQDTSVVFGHFKSMCADGEGAGPRAVAMARAAGWAPVPASVFAGEGDNPFKDATALMNAEDSGDVTVLLVGTMEETYEGTPMTMGFCAVMGGDFETGAPVKPDPRPMLRRWVGVEAHPSLVDEGMIGYAFTRRDGQIVAVRRSEAALMQSALNGELHIVMTNEETAEEPLAMLMYMRPSF